LLSQQNYTLGVPMITKEHLKQEIEQLDEHYLELVFRLLQQFPHHEKIIQGYASRTFLMLD
jgi:hypothetical protein